jgi:hypothetical protein
MSPLMPSPIPRSGEKRAQQNARILLANLFPCDTAAMAALDSPGSCPFNNGICEAQCSALWGWPTVSARYLDMRHEGPYCRHHVHRNSVHQVRCFAA